MSPLLPERHQLGLFPGYSSLQIGMRRRPVTVGCNGRDIGSLLDTVRELLPNEGVGRPWRSPLDVTVSDEFMRIAFLPWQDRLRTEGQMVKYAEACISENGEDISSEWATRPLFRRYGAPGIAVAARREHIEHLNSISKERRLWLRSVLPLSALAYWSDRGIKTGPRSLLFLEEPNRVTVLSYTEGILRGIDVEPVLAGKTEHAINRLFIRGSVEAMPSGVRYCSALASNSRQPLFKVLAPDMPFKDFQLGLPR